MYKKNDCSGSDGALFSGIDMCPYACGDKAKVKGMIITDFMVRSIFFPDRRNLDSEVRRGSQRKV
jgi:hypothetical protein